MSDQEEDCFGGAYHVSAGSVEEWASELVRRMDRWDDTKQGRFVLDILQSALTKARMRLTTVDRDQLAGLQVEARTYEAVIALLSGVMGHAARAHELMKSEARAEADKKRWSYRFAEGRRDLELGSSV